MDAALAALRDRLDRQGLAAGMEFLNQRVPHRFTGVYRLNARILSSVALFDKLGDALPHPLKKLPLDDSFCQFVLTDGSFVTGDSGRDPRLKGHRYQGVLNSYVGLPLTGPGDDLQGTLCHFDFAQRTLPEAELGFLRQAALLLARYLPRS